MNYKSSMEDISSIVSGSSDGGGYEVWEDCILSSLQVDQVGKVALDSSPIVPIKDISRKDSFEHTKGNVNELKWNVINSKEDIICEKENEMSLNPCISAKNNDNGISCSVSNNDVDETCRVSDCKGFRNQEILLNTVSDMNIDVKSQQGVLEDSQLDLFECGNLSGQGLERSQSQLIQDDKTLNIEESSCQDPAFSCKALPFSFSSRESSQNLFSQTHTPTSYHLHTVNQKSKTIALSEKEETLSVKSSSTIQPNRLLELEEFTSFGTCTHSSQLLLSLPLDGKAMKSPQRSKGLLLPSLTDNHQHLNSGFQTQNLNDSCIEMIKENQNNTSPCSNSSSLLLLGPSNVCKKNISSSQQSLLPPSIESSSKNDNSSHKDFSGNGHSGEVSQEPSSSGRMSLSNTTAGPPLHQQAKKEQKQKEASSSCKKTEILALKNHEKKMTSLHRLDVLCNQIDSCLNGSGSDSMDVESYSNRCEKLIIQMHSMQKEEKTKLCSALKETCLSKQKKKSLKTELQLLKSRHETLMNVVKRLGKVKDRIKKTEGSHDRGLPFSMAPSKYQKPRTSAETCDNRATEECRQPEPYHMSSQVDKMMIDTDIFNHTRNGQSQSQIFDDYNIIEVSQSTVEEAAESGKCTKSLKLECDEDVVIVSSSLPKKSLVTKSKSDGNLNLNENENEISPVKISERKITVDNRSKHDFNDDIVRKVGDDDKVLNLHSQIKTTVSSSVCNAIDKICNNDENMYATTEQTIFNNPSPVIKSSKFTLYSSESKRVSKFQPPVKKQSCNDKDFNINKKHHQDVSKSFEEENALKQKITVTATTKTSVQPNVVLSTDSRGNVSVVHPNVTEKSILIDNINIPNSSCISPSLKESSVCIDGFLFTEFHDPSKENTSGIFAGIDGKSNVVEEVETDTKACMLSNSGTKQPPVDSETSTTIETNRNTMMNLNTVAASVCSRPIPINNELAITTPTPTVSCKETTVNCTADDKYVAASSKPNSSIISALLLSLGQEPSIAVIPDFKSSNDILPNPLERKEKAQSLSPQSPPMNEVNQIQLPYPSTEKQCLLSPTSTETSSLFPVSSKEIAARRLNIDRLSNRTKPPVFTTSSTPITLTETPFPSKCRASSPNKSKDLVVQTKIASKLQLLQSTPVNSPNPILQPKAATNVESQKFSVRPTSRAETLLSPPSKKMIVVDRRSMANVSLSKFTPTISTTVPLMSKPNLNLNYQNRFPPTTTTTTHDLISEAGPPSLKDTIATTTTTTTNSFEHWRLISSIQQATKPKRIRKSKAKMETQCTQTSPETKTTVANDTMKMTNRLFSKTTSRFTNDISHNELKENQNQRYKQPFMNMSSVMSSLKTVKLIRDQELVSTVSEDIPAQFWNMDFSQITMSEYIWDSVVDW